LTLLYGAVGGRDVSEPFVPGQLMWNPDADVTALLAEFFPKVYGLSAVPMSGYWLGDLCGLGGDAFDRARILRRADDLGVLKGIASRIRQAG
jgi:hypothetical protein